MAQFDSESFRSQQTTFSFLNLCVLAALLFLHTLFSQVLGNPSPLLLFTLGAAFLAKLLELLWLQSGPSALSRSGGLAFSWVSIGINLILTLLLTFLTNKEESPYFVLLALPVLQAAYQLRLSALISVMAIADSMMLFWVWHFSTFHPPVHASEYLEAGVLSLIYTLVGLLVWSLVNQIRRDRDKLSENMQELQRTRTKLDEEEKLAAIGRLSSAIAHEIRNPVAMIASSMATAESVGTTAEVREEMFAIAAAEASRLERLTSEFLSYARPCSPRRAPTVISELLGYIAEVAKPHAARKGATIAVDVSDGLCGNVDGEQVQRAVLNLVMNAIDAAVPESEVHMSASDCEPGEIQIQVENVGEPIAGEVLANIFEPFYTTKTRGTGLGLAIARNIARAHCGDIVVDCNERHKVCFTILLRKTDLANVATGGASRWVES